VLIISVATSATGPYADGDAGDADSEKPPWTTDECAVAIRRLISDEPEYPLRYVGTRQLRWVDPWVVEHFVGPEAGEHLADTFYVDPHAQYVVRARLHTRMEQRYYRVDSPFYGRQEVDIEAARKLATEVAARNCPQIMLADHIVSEKTIASPYIFTWEEVQEPWGVRLPRTLSVGVDAITGEFCWWELELRPIVINLEPKLTREDVARIIERAYRLPPEQLADVVPVCIGGGDGQRIMWYADYNTDHGRLTACVDDATSKPEGTL